MTEARWDGSLAWIEEEAQASRIVDKTGAGIRHGTRLALVPIEAAWLATQGRIRLAGTSLADLLAGHAQETSYLLYCDLRARGLMVRPDGPLLAVWARGESPAALPAWHVAPCGERGTVSASDIAGWAMQGTHAGVVDEDGAVTYYRLAQEDPAGAVPPVALEPLEGTSLASHVLLQDDAPHSLEAMGTPHPAGLLLSPVEAAHLQRRALLAAGTLPTTPRIDVQSPVFDDLRRRGVVPRSGLRFGADLRAYRRRPDEGHADWLVHCAAPEDRLAWSELSRGVRLAHSVRKRFLVAVAGPTVTYTWISWHRP